MNDFLFYMRDRLREPSTWRGLILVATAAGATISPQSADAIITLGIALAGGIGAATSDK
jgi:hypothetical protein